MKKILPLLLLIFAVISTTHAQDDPLLKGLDAISEQAVKAQLDFLASDWMEGRETGEKGIDMAADYIASMFQVYGLQPGENTKKHFGRADLYDMRSINASANSYFQEFALMRSSQSDDHALAVITGTGGGKKITHFGYKNDFTFARQPVISQEGEFSVVFAGYGLVNEEQHYDDYKGINVKGKVVLRLVGYPGHRDTTSEAYHKFHPAGNEWTKYRDEMDRNNLAMTKGAVAVIMVYTVKDITQRFAVNVFRYNYDDYEGDVPKPAAKSRIFLPDDTLTGCIPAFVASLRMANELTAGTKISLEAFERQACETMKPGSKDLSNKKIWLRSTVNTEVIKAKNILGMIEGENPNEVVIVGGHYDHLGKHNGYIYNGSDDNASGTVAVMTIARACMAMGVKPRRTIIFAAWTAEEKGLFGSEYFADHPPAGKIVSYLNYDMISRNAKDDPAGVNCSMTYTQRCKVLEDISRKYNEQYALGLQVKYKPREKPSGGSDHNAFVKKDIPIFYYMAGGHEDYHKPQDHSSKANIAKMTNIIRLGFLGVWDIANREVFP
ncbi:MAG: M20/M25/M40 family metallo-hydrolase [Bacteroidales bacterium]|nr:M20/M25/M40 family metallo-hydrolase [Bacteroidales bacterium]MBN2763733.1 M20/M25/M40 family metallo-hydrolase [Bacteroidales bacterium]